MWFSTQIVSASLLFVSSVSAATTQVQGNCAQGDAGLTWLKSKLSPSAVISCAGQPLQLYNAGRYWGEQYGKNASVVVFPTTKEDVSYSVQASAISIHGRDLTFVSGGHGQTNASSSTGFIIDLSWLNKTTVLHNVKVDDTTIDVAVAYQGGATWAGVENATAGTNYTAVGARVGSVGVGGFSTGGGIGFLAGAYGFATDRLRAIEVVLMDGRIVNATKTNCYSDLFFALQGGNGQFGIGVMFYQEAALTPQLSTVTLWNIAPGSQDQARKNTVDWFNSNDDPFSLMYYALVYTADDLATGPLGVQTLLVGLQFGDPTNPKQKTFNQTFAPLINGLEIEFADPYALTYPVLTQFLDPFFPYGFRRGFWGPQITNITADYLADIASEYDYQNVTLSSFADQPAGGQGLWALQYMYPGLNGNLPKSDSDTAWPHSVVGHQTLYSPAWLKSSDDAFVKSSNDKFSNITYAAQSKLSPSFIADYPNYISPGVTAERVYGGNVQRLIQIKQKYDPLCRLHQGRVWATAACKAGGWANLY